MNLATEDESIENSTSSRSSYRTFMLYILISLLAFVNILVAFPLTSVKKSVSELEVEVELLLQQKEELQKLEDRHLHGTSAFASNIETQMRFLHKHCSSGNEFFPILDNTFVTYDGDLRTLGRKTYLAVPRSGTHRLRVLIENYVPSDQKRSTILFSKRFDLQSAKGYEFEFVLAGSKLRVSLSDIASFDVNLGNKRFAESISRIQPKNRTFFCPNEPHWHRNTGVFSETGLVEDFAFLQIGAETQTYLRVRVFVESDGPITSAPDDRETVRNLLWGTVETEVPHQFKDGRYIFQTWKRSDSKTRPPNQSY